jgi:hypothetical protein
MYFQMFPVKFPPTRSEVLSAERRLFSFLHRAYSLLTFYIRIAFLIVSYINPKLVLIPSGKLYPFVSARAWEAEY